MTKKLYEILGIKSNISKKGIKSAYRKQAKTHHPDKPNGNKEKFEEINLAYRILIDDGSRHHYDQTGEFQENSEQKRKQEFENMIFQNLLQMFTNTDFEYKDPISFLLDKMQSHVSGLKNDINVLERKIKCIQKNTKRLKVKDKVLFPSILKKFEIAEQSLKMDLKIKIQEIEINKEYMENLKNGLDFNFSKKEDPEYQSMLSNSILKDIRF